MSTNQTEIAPRTDKPRKLIQDYIEDHDAAAELDISVRTLRRIPDGPPFVIIGRKRRYPVEQFRKWIAKRVRISAAAR